MTADATKRPGAARKSRPGPMEDTKLVPAGPCGFCKHWTQRPDDGDVGSCELAFNEGNSGDIDEEGVKMRAYSGDLATMEQFPAMLQTHRTFGCRLYMLDPER